MQYYDKYIVTKRFKGKTISGELNLPYGTECHTIEANGDRAIVCEKGIVCYVGSYVAFDCFSQNDDGNGKERGRLKTAIIKKLQRKEYDSTYDNRWEKVWNDSICKKYKNPEFTDHWLWNYDFYNAPIEDLSHIARLVGTK